MKKLVLALVVVAGLNPGSVRAQTTASRIAQAVDLYSKLEIEAARPLLLEVLSSSWLQPISTEQRVQALKYLGASYAVNQKADSATRYFTAALAYDPFTDLDRALFSPNELAAFELAKTQIFRIGVKGLQNKVIDPKVPENAYPIRITNTQQADITITVFLKNGLRDSTSEVVFRGTNDGYREVTWRGMMAGRIAPPGNYKLKISARKPPPSAEQADDSLDFQIVHSHEPLEDSLPPLSLQDTLVASYSTRSPIYDLTKGVVLGAAAFGLSFIALDADKVDPAAKGKWTAQWSIASLIGVGSGVGSFAYRRNNLLKTEAVAENARRRQRWIDFNAGVARRNADRLDKTKLIITPR